jgi:ATP-binding cassette subfamily F protein uup
MASLLQVEGLTKSFGDLVLLTDINFSIAADQRVGLIARNGAGKTTLLRIIAGLESPDSGKVVWQKGTRFGYLDQNPDLDQSRTILENVFRGNDEASKAISRYELALEKSDRDELQKATELMDNLNAWDIEVRARQILSKLKLHDLDQSISTLSGGQQKRVALAASLISDPDFLILDEPTNHLDLDMVEWLEEYLRTCRITLFMVTHDRYFLDRICNVIIEIDEREIYSYSGGFSYYLEKRQERIESRALQVEKATNIYRRELEWMRRSPPARTTKAKYRIDAFYSIREQASQRFYDGSVRINVGAARLGSKIIEVKGLSKSFDKLKVIDNFSYTFNRFERLGIVGRNGTGKSTFLNLITGNIPLDSGVIETGETVVFGYYRQDGMDIRDDMKVIDVAREIAEVVKLADGKTLTVSQFLGMFLFPPSTQNAFVYKLSGGEKRRLFLCTILMKSPNFLILDEPTNDLDIQTLQILEEYLENFPGVVLVVSHDRHFLDKVVDGLLIFEGDGEISGFPGSYTDYYEWNKEQQKEAEVAKPKAETKPKSSPAAKKPAKMSFAEKRELETLSAEVDSLENEKAQLEAEANSGTLDHHNLAKKSARIGEIINLLDTKGERWLELMEKMEGE